MSTIVRPAKPVQPRELRDLIDCHNAAQRAANGAVRGMVHGLPGMGEAFTRYTEEAAEWSAEIRRWYDETPEGRAYYASVQTWNAYVHASRAEAKVNRQVRANAREVSAVRSAACPRCFSTHPGEC